MQEKNEAEEGERKDFVGEKAYVATFSKNILGREES